MRNVGVSFRVVAFFPERGDESVTTSESATEEVVRALEDAGIPAFVESEGFVGSGMSTGLEVVILA